MRRREFAGLVAASALVTLDGTATTVALPAIQKSLELRYAGMQWIGDAPLLALAALLLPAGIVADRVGRLRTTRLGLLGFIGASAAAAAAPSAAWLIAARLAQGAAGALILPAVVAILRAAHQDSAERTRVFGVWAAVTGLASAAGPLLGGVMIDLWSWRAIFALTVAAAAGSLWMLRGARGPAAASAAPVPLASTAVVAVAIAAIAYVLIEVPSGGWTRTATIVSALGAAAAAALLALPRRQRLVPAAMLRSRNCLAGNAATFALYFGLFGLSFLIVVYTQQVLGYSGTWSGAGILPVSVALLLLAEPFGRGASRWGSRRTIVVGSALAAAGVTWIATGPDPLPFWSRIIAGSTIFGLGISLAVSALTQVAVASVPEDSAGIASGLNHATVRAGGLIAIALLGSMAAGDSGSISTEGLRLALLTCGAVIALVGALSAALVDDRAPGGLVRASAAVPNRAPSAD